MHVEVKPDGSYGQLVTWPDRAMIDAAEAGAIAALCALGYQLAGVECVGGALGMYTATYCNRAGHQVALSVDHGAWEAVA